MQNNYLLIYLFLLIFPMMSLALDSDKNQPANISANSAEMNQKSGISVFNGNVLITQGSTKITADQITTYTDKNHKLKEAIATGNPATYQTLPNTKDPVFQASANKIEYYPLNHQVILIGNGKLQQGENVLQNNYIVFDQQTGKLITKPYNNSRTTITLAPKQSS